MTNILNITSDALIDALSLSLVEKNINLQLNYSPDQELFRASIIKGGLITTVFDDNLYSLFLRISMESNKLSE